MRVIDENGDNLGEISREEALSLAREKELDLIEVAPDARPPVCKILDWGKFQYEQEKEQRKQKAKSKRVSLKEVRLTFKMAAHDLEIRAKQANGFLEEGQKVKVQLFLRGRERAHRQAAIDKINEFVKSLGERVAVDGGVTASGPMISALLKRK